MIIEKKTLVTGDVVTIRLTTGEEMVARLVADIDSFGTAVVTKPILLQMAVDPNTGQVNGVGFAPFMVGVPEDSKFEILRANMLVSPIKTRDEIAKNYLQATSSIEIPKKKGLIV